MDLNCPLFLLKECENLTAINLKSGFGEEGLNIVYTHFVTFLWCERGSLTKKNKGLYPNLLYMIWRYKRVSIYIIYIINIVKRA